MPTPTLEATGPAITELKAPSISVPEVGVQASDISPGPSIETGMADKLQSAPSGDTHKAIESIPDLADKTPGELKTSLELAMEKDYGLGEKKADTAVAEPPSTEQGEVEEVATATPQPETSADAGGSGDNGKTSAGAEAGASGDSPPPDDKEATLDRPAYSEESGDSVKEPEAETKNEAQADTSSNVGYTEAEKAELSELQRMKEANEDMTGEQLKRLRELEGKNPDKLYESLEERYNNGDPTLTQEDFDTYARLRNERIAQQKEGMTEEQKQEQLDKEIESLGTDLMYKMAHGEYESDEAFQQDLKQLQDKMAEKSLEEKGFTKEQARAAVSEANRRGNERAVRRDSYIQDRIQELMTIEYQILTIPPQVTKLREARDKAIGDAKKLHDAAQNEREGTQARLEAKAKEYNAYMVVENYNANIVGTIHMADRLNERRRDIEQDVRAKLGVSGRWGALMEWGANRVINASTELRITAEDKYSWATNTVV